ncbi:MAG TPA: FAD-dependent oxidoreductase [Opitutaceae bacterium]|nr:FAD-dependent oxidoreductase [Opitutaceae bacterium]
MNQSEQQTVSWWLDNKLGFDEAMLRDDTTADVCVIGAGLSGLTTAYLLAKENLRVVVLDAGTPTYGETSRTTAHLSNAIDDRYYNIERWHGQDGAKIAARAHTTAIDTIERIAREENIDCEFTRLDGYLFPAPGESSHVLEQELEAAHRAGLVDVEFHPGPRGASFPSERCLRFPRQGQFNPLRYLDGLIRAIEAQESRIFANSRVVDITEGDEIIVTTENGYKVRCGSVVVATNSPINDRVALQTKIAPYRTYAIAARIRKGSAPKALLWDNADPYHYVRTAQSSETFDTLIIGGEDHKTGQESQTADRFGALERWARAHFPQIESVTHQWSGQVLETLDGLAYAGRNPGSSKNCYVITGDSGMGMTHGTIGAMIVTDLIQGRANAWADTFEPSRITLSAGLTFAKENFNVARQYLDWGRPSESEETAHPPANSGCVVQRGVQKIALFHSADGIMHEMSAVCPHLGCIVHWNDTEHTWDCPCHGSRFNATGDVIGGPATSPLTPILSHAKT